MEFIQWLSTESWSRDLFVGSVACIGVLFAIFVFVLWLTKDVPTNVDRNTYLPPVPESESRYIWDPAIGNNGGYIDTETGSWVEKHNVPWDER